jgi:hypothetical protein
MRTEHLHSNCQQTLLQKDQPRSSRDPAIADSFLKYNRNLPAQQCFCAPRDFVLNRSDQLRSGSGYVASQDENLRIEGVQDAHQRSPKILQCPVDYIARALVSTSGCTEDGLGIRRMASATH